MRSAISSPQPAWASLSESCWCRASPRGFSEPRLSIGLWSIGGVALLLLALSREILTLLLAPNPVPQILEIVVAGALAALLGVCNALVLVPSQTMLQERSHEHIRARVYGTFFTITSVVSFVPIFFAAAVADLFGVVTVLAGVAIALMAVGSVSLIRARLGEQQLHERLPTRGSPIP